MNSTPAQATRLFTFASGGWVLLLTGLITLALVAWAVAPALMRSVYHPPGDNKNIDTYLFDLADLQIPRQEILPIMIHRDMVPVMFDPTAAGPTPGDDTDSHWKAMQRRNDPQYGKYLVGDDRVIGVEINGESRCYPLSVMTVHEIINDTLGDPGSEVPIAVTYNWPCDSVMVFDRRVNGATLEFGVSGLLYNSNLLMYDVRRETAGGTPRIGGESLFSQLLAQGVSGPLAGVPLKIISCSLTSWRDWSAAHPQTTVLDCDLSIAKRYKDAAPNLYFQDPRPLRPVKPRMLPVGSSPPAAIDLPTKSRVIIVQAGDDPQSRRVFPISMMDGLADKNGQWITTINDVSWQFQLDRKTQNVTVQSDPPGRGMTIGYSFWFAWQAMHPEDAVIVR